MNNIEYRKIKGIEECKLCENLQLTVWGFSEREVFPARHLLTAQQNGGLVIGAFSDTGKLVGFSYGFLGYSEGKYYLYSHMLGVLDEYKYKNIGYNLKLLQRKIIQERGFSLIKWTFDPLESPNAYLNLHKLGAVIKTYYIDYYGEFRGINYGLPTDRFLVEWELNTHRVTERVEKQNISPVNPSEYPVVTETFYNEKGLLELKKVELNFTEKKFFVEIPSNIQEIKSLDFKAAIDWRNKTRDIFTSYLTGKYCITDFCTFNYDKKLRKSFYLLERY